MLLDKCVRHQPRHIIASWDIRALVVFAPNLALCHLHAAYYHARYPTDDWHLVYFSVEVCLEGVFPHSVSTRRDPFVRVNAPLTLATPREKTKSNRGDPALHLHQARGHLNWRMGLPALYGGNLGLLGNLISTCVTQFMGYVKSKIHYGLKVVFYFRHFTVFHCHHYSRLIAGTEHI